MQDYPTRKVEVYTTEWVDITSYVISTIKIKEGMGGTSYLDRVAYPGEMTFTLKNDEGKFSPNISTTLSGWQKNIAIRLTLTFENASFIKFRGTINKIKLKIVPGSNSNTVEVTAYDWMDYASTHPASLASQANKKIGEAVTSIVADMPLQPQNTDYDVDGDTFPSVFDDLGENTKVATEFQKLALSELGYIYLVKDKVYGETLVVESRQRRIDKEADYYAYSKLNSPHYKKQNGAIYKKNTGAIYIKNERDIISYTNSFLPGPEIPPWEDVINQVKLTVYPRQIDTDLSTLYAVNPGRSSSNSIYVAAGSTVTGLSGNYVDPRGGGTKINGTNMQTPVANTDYKMYLNSDGTGTDLTANLTITPDYINSSKVQYTLTNTGGTGGYVYWINFKGYAVYLDNPSIYEKIDTTSINAYNYQPLKIDQKYQSKVDDIIPLILLIVNSNKDPRSVLKKIRVNANSNGLTKYLYLNVGDLVYIQEDISGVSGYFFVQSINTEITVGGIVNYELSVLESLTFSLTEFTWDESDWDGPDTWAF